MNFILTNAHRDVLSSTGIGAGWLTRAYHEQTDYSFAIVFPSRESAEEACAARGDGAVVDKLPEDL